MHLTYQEAMASPCLTDLAEPPPVPGRVFFLEGCSGKPSMEKSVTAFQGQTWRNMLHYFFVC